MKRKINFGAIVTYYIIAIVCRYFTNKTELLSSFESPYLKSILTGVGPAIGATAVFLIFNIKPVLSLKGNYKNMLIPIALYWVFPIALISMVSYVTLGKIPYLAVSSVLIYGLLEEIGWRGFLYQELKALSPLSNLFILSVLWYLWHLNFDFTPIQISFFVILVLGSWGIGKVADSTGSLIAVSAFHSLNNFFPTMNTKSGAILGTLLIVWIVNLVLRKRKMERG